MGYTVRSWEAEAAPPQALGAFLDMLAGLGYNNLSLDIAWADVEPQPGQYDFSLYDRLLAVAEERGFTLQLKLNTRALPPWIGEDKLVRDPDGNLPGGTAFHTLADPEVNAQIAAFARAVAEHYRGRPNLFYCGAFAVSFETEYHHSIWTDYSEPALRQFRAFLRTQYDDLADLNAAWETTYPSFDDVQFEFRGQCRSLTDRRYVDFQRYREDAAGRFFDGVADAVHAGDPEARYGPQVGRIFSPECIRRGTVSVFRWARNCDVIFVDPAPLDDYPWSVTVARASGKLIAVELDGVYAYRRDGLLPRLAEVYAEQTRLSFEHGASYVAHANWGPQEFGELQSVFPLCATAKQVPPRRTVATTAIYVSKWDEYCYEGRQGESASQAAQRLFSELLAAGTAADIISDDLFTEDPAFLERYDRIHVPGGQVISAAAWEALHRCRADVVVAPGLGPFVDELGEHEWPVW